MERIYILWLVNRKKKIETLIRCFHDSELALQNQKKEEEELKRCGKALEYDYRLTSEVVY